MLILSSDDGLGGDAQALAAAVIGAGGSPSAVAMKTDHSYNDHRIALAAAIVGWLQTNFR